MTTVWAGQLALFCFQCFKPRKLPNVFSVLGFICGIVVYFWFWGVCFFFITEVIICIRPGLDCGKVGDQ